MRRAPRWIIAVGIALALLAPGGAPVADDAALPADQVIAAIRLAMAAQPGNVESVDVERKGGRTLVEVDVRASDGKKVEVKIDVERNEVLAPRK